MKKFIYMFCCTFILSMLSMQTAFADAASDTAD